MEGQQKLFYLPYPFSDFIYAVIGEELGLLGAAAVLFAFLVFLWRGARAAWEAPDHFGTYLAAGLVLSIVMQAMINVSVVLGLLPTKGIPLPFISAAGRRCSPRWSRWGSFSTCLNMGTEWRARSSLRQAERGGTSSRASRWRTSCSVETPRHASSSSGRLAGSKRASFPAPAIRSSCLPSCRSCASVWAGRSWDCSSCRGARPCGMAARPHASDRGPRCGRLRRGTAAAGRRAGEGADRDPGAQRATRLHGIGCCDPS